MTGHVCQACYETPLHPDRYVCRTCADKVLAALRTDVYLAGHLDSLRAGEKAIRYDGDVVTGGKGGGVGVNLRISEVANRVRVDLHGTARICNERGPEDVGTEWAPDAQSIASVALWLMQFVPWLTTQADGPDEVRSILLGAKALESLWPVPDDRVFLGLCHAETDAGVCTVPLKARPPANAGQVTCRQCGTVHDIAERRQQLALVLEDAHLTTRELLWVFSGRITERTLYRWVDSGRVKVSGKRPVWTGKGDRTANVYRVGEVMRAIESKEASEVRRRAA